MNFSLCQNRSNYCFVNSLIRENLAVKYFFKVRQHPSARAVIAKIIIGRPYYYAWPNVFIIYLIVAISFEKRRDCSREIPFLIFGHALRMTWTQKIVIAMEFKHTITSEFSKVLQLSFNHWCNLEILLYYFDHIKNIICLLIWNLLCEYWNTIYSMNFAPAFVL